MIKKVITTTTYVTFNGKSFKTEKDCREYEYSITNNLPICYDKQGNIISFNDSNKDNIYIVELCSQEAVEAFKFFEESLHYDVEGISEEKANIYFNISNDSQKKIWQSIDDFEKENYLYMTAKRIKKERGE